MFSCLYNLLQVSKSTESDPKSVAMKCEQCGMEYEKLFQLVRHVQSKHDDMDSHKCCFCSIPYPTGVALAKHLKEHRPKPHKCPICPKTYYQAGYLEVHKRTHTGETPFLCNICGRKFNSGKGMAAHIQRHSDEKPFACGHCPMRFYSNRDLRNHERIHTGERPYLCEICGKSFPKSCVLNSHKQSHTVTEEPLSCKTCGKTFKCRTYLKVLFYANQMPPHLTIAIDLRDFSSNTNGLTRVDGPLSASTVDGDLTRRTSSLIT